jgi:hypothetical protein
MNKFLDNLGDFTKNWGFLLVMLTVLAMTGIQPAKAQAVARTYAYCNGTWYPGSCNGGGVPLMIPQGVSMGQPFNTMISGQRMRCSWGDKVANALWDGVVANATTYAVNRLFNTKIDRTGATVAGGVAGATIFCDPSMVDDGEMSTRQVPVTQQVSRTQTQRRPVSSGESIEIPAECDFHYADGTKIYTYDGKAGCDKIASKLSREVTTESSQNQTTDRKLNTNRQASFQFSGEGTGEGVCRMKSDGQARLADSPEKLLTRGEVIAVSEKTSDSGSAQVSPIQSGESCSAWRRRVADNLLWRG